MVTNVLGLGSCNDVYISFILNSRRNKNFFKTSQRNEKFNYEKVGKIGLNVGIFCPFLFIISRISGVIFLSILVIRSKYSALICKISAKNQRNTLDSIGVFYCDIFIYMFRLVILPSSDFSVT